MVMPSGDVMISLVWVVAISVVFCAAWRVAPPTQSLHPYLPLQLALVDFAFVVALVVAAAAVVVMIVVEAAAAVPPLLERDADPVLAVETVVVDCSPLCAEWQALASTSGSTLDGRRPRGWNA